MGIELGCTLELHCEATTPMLALLSPHQDRRGDLHGPERWTLRPEQPLTILMDREGNHWCRFLAAAGPNQLSYGATVEDDGRSDPVVPTARACPIEALPIDAYRYLNPSRYCDSDRLAARAWGEFGHRTPGWALVQAICDWTHARIRFDYAAARSDRSASEALEDGVGVCRDYAHLAIALCRCLNIPARYCTGYLGYTGISRGSAPVDFSAWFEVFLEDRWYVFDARHNTPRQGRVLIGRGRDAADVPFLRSFGAHRLERFAVITEASVITGASVISVAGDAGERNGTTG